MRITFLGHQGWQFENHGRSFLLDPILEEIGNGAVRLPVWPHRRLDFARFEPLDGVIISHEHADHFSLETLAALPRRCRIYIPDLASAAMDATIRELGFQVERFPALQAFMLGGMRVTPLPGLYNMLEPDTYALLIEDELGSSFLTSIDTIAHPDVFAWLAQRCPQRTLDNLTNNFVESRQRLVSDPSAHTGSRATVVGNMIDFTQKFAPRRAVVSGQGWSFKDSKSHLNHAFFSVDNAWLTKTARELAPQVEWFEGVPGLRFTLRGLDIAVDHVAVIGPVQRPSREFMPACVRVPEPFAAWTGIDEIPAERVSKVRDFIRDSFGQILSAHAPKLMEALYYLKFQHPAELSPTLAIHARNGTARTIFEFGYGQACFREVTRPTRPAAAGFEIWAADLELLLGAEEEVFLVYESAVRPWSYVPALLAESMLIECFMWFTPRFRPAEFLAFYRSRIAQLRTRSSSAA